MNVVLSDIEAPKLDDAVAEVAAHGTRAIGQITDVADGAAVDQLADLAGEFAGVHVLCNNAGVAEAPNPDFISMGAWEWVMGGNFWGVVHGHRAFIPRMIEQGEGHVVNTASMAGHLPGHSPYTASKWAVVGITQGLYTRWPPTRPVSVCRVCAGVGPHRDRRASRNQPESAALPALFEPTEEQQAARAFVKAAIDGGMEPDAVADLVHDAIVNNRFWIFTDLGMVEMLRSTPASSRTETRRSSGLSTSTSRWRDGRPPCGRT